MCVWLSAKTVGTLSISMVQTERQEMSKALELADDLEAEFPSYSPMLEAAAELRRLDAQVQSLSKASKMAYSWFYREGDGPTAPEVHAALGRALEQTEKNYLIESASDEAGEVYERKV